MAVYKTVSYCNFLQQLRLLRHPNIIKYLDSEMSHDQIVLITEPLIPVFQVLEGTSIDAVVMGWRGVAAGLDFLHKKAGLSHNNLSSDCVFVNVLDGRWKLGGFEASSRHKAIDTMVRSLE